MVDTISYGKEFGFLSSNVNSMVESFDYRFVLQIRYSLVVILGLNSVSGVQYKDMMIDR